MNALPALERLVEAVSALGAAGADPLIWFMAGIFIFIAFVVVTPAVWSRKLPRRRAALEVLRVLLDRTDNGDSTDQKEK